jgi:diguanylate cyclase (GGDEF)-like protein
MIDFAGSFEELRDLGVEDRLPAGALLWREGDPGDEVVLLVEGELEVLHESDESEGERVVLRTLASGAILGELASLDGQARSATVRTSKPCRVLRISAASFRELLKRRTDILEQLFWEQVERVRSLTRDVTRTHRRAITDPLTQLYNFGFFRERLRLELERAAATGDPVSLVIFDIDHFKHYNDANGHQEGNVALVQVADVLRKTGRRGDVVARYGGEEFVGLLYGATREEATRFAEAVRQAIESTPFKGGESQPLGRVTVSGGVASYPVDARTEESLIQVADQNLYRAKEGGRNRIVASGDATGVV